MQTEFNHLSSARAEEMLLKCQHSQYEYGDKASKLLSHQLRSAAAAHSIPRIQTSSSVSMDPKIINNQFRDFYSLYASESVFSTESLGSFFNHLKLPSIDQTHSLRLEGPITVEEILQAISKLQCSKCPGQDGSPVEFYRKFMPRLAPLMVNMYKHSLEVGSLPPSLLQASIPLILKKDKDPLQCGSYRPISLLNVDYKILAKLLAMRVDNHLLVGTSLYFPVCRCQNKWHIF